MDFLWKLSEIRTPFWDGVMSVITKFGEETAAIVIVCLIYWCISKRTAYAVGASVFLTGLTVQSMKVGFRIERPWVLDPDFQPVESALAHATGFSFPSGHTSTACAVYGTLGTAAKRRWLAPALYLLALLVGFSRMYLGVHTPADVSVAIVIGVAVILLSARFFREGAYCEGKLSGRDIALSVLFAAAAIFALVFGLCLYKSGAIEYKYFSDCCKQAGAAFGFAVGYYIERAYIHFETKTEELWQQAVKVIVGVGVLVGLKSGLKLLLGSSILTDTVRYAVIILWAICVWPLIFKTFFPVREQK